MVLFILGTRQVFQGDYGNWNLIFPDVDLRVAKLLEEKCPKLSWIPQKGEMCVKCSSLTYPLGEAIPLAFVTKIAKENNIEEIATLMKELWQQAVMEAAKACSFNCNTYEDLCALRDRFGPPSTPCKKPLYGMPPCSYPNTPSDLPY